MLKTPLSVVIVCGTVLGAVLAICVTLLSVYGKGSDDLLKLVNLLLGSAGMLFGSGALLYSGAAAKSASNTEDAIHNGVLKQKVKIAMQEALQEHDEQ